jgi:hypothetical protein
MAAFACFQDPSCSGFQQGIKNQENPVVVVLNSFCRFIYATKGSTYETDIKGKSQEKPALRLI